MEKELFSYLGGELSTSSKGTCKCPRKKDEVVQLWETE